MKQISILGGKAHVVELPEGSRLFEIVRTYWGDDRGCDRLRWSYPKQGQKWLETGEISLPPGTWQIVGLLSEVREEEAAGIVESDDQYGVTMYRNYKTTGMPYYDEQITAIESLDSSILAEGHYLDESPIKRTQFTNPDIWDSIQSRVLSRERCLLLRRES